jgi:hypothetical protein
MFCILLTNMKTFRAPRRFAAVAHAIAASVLLMLGACSEKAPTQDAPKSGTTQESTFSEGLPMPLIGALALRSDCNMESINGQPFLGEPYKLAPSGTMEIRGWVLDIPNNAVPEQVFVRAASQEGNRVWYAPVSLSVERADVAALRGGSESYRRSGYSAKIKTAALPAGSYRLQVIYATKTEKAICDNGRVMVLGG